MKKISTGRKAFLNADLSLHLGDNDAFAASSIRLLERIGASGSISQAAKDCGISYRTAWQAVERLQNRSAAPLVERNAGGLAGGGTVLTADGRKLVEMYRAAETEHKRFVQLLGSNLEEYQKHTKFIRRWFMKTSVRNQMQGTVRELSNGPVNTEVVVDIGGDDRLTAIITSDGAGEMQLAVGKEVSVLIKESSVILCLGDKLPPLSTRNRLKGRVLRWHEGVVCTEVTVQLPGSKVITAVITFESMAEMKLLPNAEVWVCFKASDVVLACQE